MHWYENFGDSGFFWMGPIFMVIFWGLIIWAIVAIVRSITGKNISRPNEDDSSLRILKERYARGEIDQKEFEEKSRQLKNL